jgi:hypothetical protein
MLRIDRLCSRKPIAVLGPTVQSSSCHTTIRLLSIVAPTIVARKTSSLATPVTSIVYTPRLIPSSSTPSIIIVVQVVAKPKGEPKKSNHETQNHTIQALAEAALQGIVGPVHVRVLHYQQMLSSSMMIFIICAFRKVGHDCLLVVEHPAKML